MRCVKVEEPPIIQEEKVSSNDRLYENLSIKIQSIDGLMKILSKKEGELTEEKKDTTTYDLMRKFIEKNPVFTRKNKFYLFNGTYYELSSANKIKQKMLGGFRDLLCDKIISFIEGAVKFLQIEPQISIEDKDVRDDLIVFNNLVLDINTGSTYYHSPMFNVTYLVNASFMGLNSPNTPVFDNFLYQITGGDAVLITRIWMMIGYILTPDTKAKSIFLLQGVGNSGKSLLVKLLQRLLSEDAFFPFDVDMLSSTFGLGDLFAKALCVCQDMPNRELNSKSVAVLKELSGDDTVSSAVKYEGPIVFDNKAKLVLVSNHAVKPKVNDDAFWDRLVVIPFKYAVDRVKQNKNLMNELLKEKDGIVTKAIMAYWELKKNNYIFPGDYSPNEVIELNGSICESLYLNIYEFIKQHFQEGGQDEYVLTETAHRLFVHNVINCSRSEFSQHYKKCVIDIFPNASEIRKRKNGKGNPIHGVKGIKLKDI